MSFGNKVLKALREFSTDVRSRFFLKRYYPGDTVMHMLYDLYPDVDWKKRVKFYIGLPWYTPLAAPFVNAQALPDFYSFSKYRIYLKKYDETIPQCLADIAHEAFHVLQGMQHLNGYGIGFLRPWMVQYIAVYMKYGYRQNPFEIPAYNQEYRFLDFCERKGLKGMVPLSSVESLREVRNEPGLVFGKFKYKYKESISMLVAAFFFCLVVAILRPLLDLLIYLITAPFYEREYRPETVPKKKTGLGRSFNTPDHLTQ
jgi:hypothetical protein